ncbi:MAG: hypothetical protein F6K35_47030 [Okeania sp. SIO2H7]|nr:hypothetical protein [Okeania sp. SIO2H7]
MIPEEITPILKNLFGEAVKTPSVDVWEVETNQFRLLVLLSENKNWLRLLIPIAPLADVRSFLEEILEANFDRTQETRYAVYQNVLWGVFQSNFLTIASEDFTTAIQRLIALKEEGIESFFQALIERQIVQIIKAAKMQGQTLEATMQNLERFYAEGLMGEIDMKPEIREKTLAAWRFQLERLWSEVD